MNGLPKKIALSIFSVALVAGTLFLDYKIEAAELKNRPVDIEITEGLGSGGAVFEQDGDSYVIKSGSAENLTAVVRENVVLRLAPGSEMIFAFSREADFAPTFSMELKKGRFWINTINSAVTSVINTDAVQMTAEPGIFDIQYGDSTVLANAIRRDLQVEFLGNRLVIPESNTMTISERKITSSGEIVSKLRYAKLLKEFPYKYVREDDEWTRFNKSEDRKFTNNLRQKFVNEVKARGPAIGGNIGSALNKFRETFNGAGLILTFDPGHRSLKQTKNALDYLDTALYAQAIGKQELAGGWINEFGNRALYLHGTSAWNSKLFDSFDRLAFVRPYDDLFDIYSSVRNFASTTPIDSIHDAFNDVLDTAASGSDTETNTRVLTMLRRFGSVVNQKASSLANPSEAPDVLFEYVVMNDFLKNNPKLLREEFLKILELFEHGHLGLIAEKEVADDSRQFFINEKLKTIRILQSVMESEDMLFQDARRSILLIASHIEALQPLKSDTAVLSYFDDQVKDLAPLIAFLRSPQAEQLHGSFGDEFTNFKSQQDEAKKVNDLLTDADGGLQISAFRREELAQKVADALGPIGVTNIKIILPEVENDPRVRITQAKLEGQAFTAVYDTVREVFSSIAIGGDAIPNAIRLENLRKFFLIRTGKLVLPGGASADSLIEQPVEAPTQSVLERVAKQTILSELTKLGVEIKEGGIGLENLDKGIVSVSLAAMEKGPDVIIFSFNITDNANTVSDLKVQTVSGDIPVNDTFELSELPVKVEQIYQRALLEKEREDELKRFLEEGNLEGTELLESLGKLSENK